MNLVLLDDGDLTADGGAVLRGARARHVHEVHRAAVGDTLRVGLLGGQVGEGVVIALAPGEVVLAPGETYRSPWLLGSWSPAGLDPLSHRFHAHLRAVTPRARTERPVIANTWEAVYFDQSLERLTEPVLVTENLRARRGDVALQLERLAGVLDQSSFACTRARDSLEPVLTELTAM